MATPIYVDPANGNDAWTGINPSGGATDGPKKTIKDAVADVTAGGVVKLIAGTYNDTNQLWSIDMPDKDVTIEPNVADTTITITRTALGSGGMFRIGADRSTRTWTFNNLAIVDAKASGIVMQIFGVAAGGNFVCNDCTFTFNATGWVANTSSIPTLDIIRSFKLTRCSITSSAAQTNNPIELVGASVYLDDCTIVDNNAALASRMLQVSNWAKDISVTNCDWTFANAAGTANAINVSDIPVYGGIRVTENDFTHTTTDQDADAVFLFYSSDSTVLNMPVIKDNTLDSKNLTSVGSRGIRLEGDVNGASVTGNKITGFAWSIYTEGQTGLYKANICDGLNAFVSWGGGYNNIVNNTLVSTDRASTGRALVLGRIEKAAEVAKNALNTFTATTFISNAAWDLSDVTDDGQQIAIAYDTQGPSPDPDYWGIVLGVNDGTDTITVDYWRDRDGTPATPVAADNYVAVSRWAENNLVESNIMVAENATNTFTFDFNPRPGQNKIDNNCYVAGTGSLMNLDSIIQEDITEVLAKWATFGTLYPDNDLNSLEEDPQLDSDYIPHNPNLKLDDNTWIGGVQPVASGGGIFVQGGTSSIYS